MNEESNSYPQNIMILHKIKLLLVLENYSRIKNLLTST